VHMTCFTEKKNLYGGGYIRILFRSNERLFTTVLNTTTSVLQINTTYAFSLSAEHASTSAANEGGAARCLHPAASTNELHAVPASPVSQQHSFSLILRARKTGAEAPTRATKTRIPATVKQSTTTENATNIIRKMAHRTQADRYKYWCSAPR
jgi:hypothetical protein